MSEFRVYNLACLTFCNRLLSVQIYLILPAIMQKMDVSITDESGVDVGRGGNGAENILDCVFSYPANAVRIEKARAQFREFNH